MYKAKEPNQEDGSRVSGTILEVCGEDKTLDLKIIIIGKTSLGYRFYRAVVRGKELLE